MIEFKLYNHPTSPCKDYKLLKKVIKTCKKMGLKLVKVEEREPKFERYNINLITILTFDKGELK